MSTQAPTQPLTRDEVIAQLRHGVEPSEIAKLTDIPVATIRTIKTRIKHELNKEVSTKLDDAIDTITALQVEVSELNEVITSKEESITKYKETITALGKTVTEKEEAITVLQKSVTGSEVTIEGLNQVIDTQHEEIVRNHKEIENSNNFITDRNTQIVEFRELVTKLEESITEKEFVITEYKERITELEKSITNADYTLQEKNTAITNFKECITKLESDVTQLQKSITSKDTDITYSKDLMTQYEEDITTYLNRITDLENTLKVRQNWQNWTYYVLPFAIFLLHVSSIQSIGHVMTMLFHEPRIGVVTGIVIATAALVIMLSDNVTKGLAITVIVTALVIEVFCNLVTIVTKNENELWNAINKIGIEPHYSYIVMALAIPLLNLALEIIFFNNKKS